MEQPTSTPDSGAAGVQGRRGSWLRWLYGLLLLALFAVVLLAVRELVTSVTLAFGQAATVRVSIPSDQVQISSALSPGAELNSDHLDATVRVVGTPALGLYHLLTWLPLAVVNVLSFWWLARLLAVGLKSDRALFSPQTTRRLRLIGVVQLAGAAVIPLTTDMIRSTISIHALGSGAYYSDLSPQAFTGGVLIGFAALAVSEVIRKGRLMLEDLEGTV
ncbi:hypothetical protein [Nonomuraea sp. NPDC049695]|uniref:hypothetical protein n=1 Tax=Nonomuraea sp. NPDC049695 TaxID=3154734 RepID=UPI00341B3DF4